MKDFWIFQHMASERKVLTLEKMWIAGGQAKYYMSGFIFCSFYEVWNFCNLVINIWNMSTLVKNKYA